MPKCIINAPTAQELLGVDVGGFSTPVCHHFKQNRECLGTTCPFFPGKAV